ncbi:unnamed protein product [Parnassius apollo]|uniref:(apollo) hypothetical protein n=1 Tax=Parnassius apollo TaxID=110799 RepID=A0A8S3XPN4_PARAO|nr:unnamed protein product [Parnassius apollo]
MSDSEGPAAKVLKLQSQNPNYEDELDEGHEEWLSEGALTDEDYNPTAEQSDSNAGNMSQDDTMQSMHDSMENPNAYHDTGDSNARDGHEKEEEENIEEILNNLENSQNKEFPGDLGAFLIRKTDGKVLRKEVPADRESELDESTKHSDDDGHDTDELLRMLGEDGVKSKKKRTTRNTKDKKPPEESSDDGDNDEFIFEGAKVTRLKMAKNAFVKKYPTKAVPEESDKDDTDMSSDEVTTMKKMFGVTKRPSNVAAKSTTTIGGINALQTVTKRVVSLDSKTDKRQQATPNKQIVVKQVQKPEVKEVKVKEPVKVRPEPEEIINEEEFLDEDEFDLDEEMESENDHDESLKKNQTDQRIMKPEQMDEEVPSDGESQSDEDSLYDEMPSSDSEDLDEWFTLDIRAERAGDYLPLLGAKAKQLLTTEKQRVGARLATLRQSLSALTESGRQQSEQLRKATATLAELDAALKAT